MTERLPVSFTQRADKHIQEQDHWWRENRTSAPEALAESLEEALVLIASQPHVGATARNVRLSGVRRVYLGRTGHYLYYRVRGRPPAAVEVLALWHSSRGSAPRL